MKLPLACLGTLAILAIGSVQAGPVPINSTQLGVQSIAGLTMNGSGVCDAAVGGCGGGFSATVAGTPNVTLWCVDSQLYDKTAYTANIVSLNTPAGTFDDGTQVRYGQVSSHNAFTTPHWLYDISDLLSPSVADQALTRYRLAAILITKYDPEQSPTNASNANNHDIQLAIWQLTENTSISVGQAGTNGQKVLNGGVRETSWISMAAASLNSFDFGGWAVASGAYASGALLAPPDAVQTYLVQVTPEPRFYGLLLVGLLSVFGILYRRRIA